MVSFSKNNPGVKCSKKTLRAHSVNSDSFTEDEGKWVTEVPYEIRDQAMCDFVKARDACWKKYQKNKEANSTPPTYKFRSRRDPTQTISVLKRNWNTKRGVFPLYSTARNLSVRANYPIV